MAEYREFRTRAAYQTGTAAPALEPQKIRDAKSEYMRNARLEVERRVEAKRRIRPGFSVPQVLVIVFAIAVILVAAWLYLVTVSNERVLKNDIDKLKKQIQVMDTENAIEARKAANEIDYAYVYAFATEDLGMQTPEKQQIIRYERKSSEFVLKAAEIPHE